MRGLAVAIVFAAACAEPPNTILEVGDPAPFRVVSYNLANLAGGPLAAIAAQVSSLAPDAVAVQECGACADLLEALGPPYAQVSVARAGVDILYDADRWRPLDVDTIVLGANDDGWGERVALRAEFIDAGNNRRVAIISTHWCVTIRGTDDSCDVDRQLDYADAILSNIACAPTTPTVLAGDFNVFDGFEEGRAVGALLSAGLIDVFRDLHPSGEATTFIGTSWAPPGRLDYIFATNPVETLSASIEPGAITTGETSDHRAVTADVLFPESD